MAYINGEFEHPIYEIKIEVLEPQKEECDFNEGMKISVDWDTFTDMDLKEFRSVITWMNEKADFIENNFTKNGKAKKIKIKG